MGNSRTTRTWTSCRICRLWGKVISGAIKIVKFDIAIVDGRRRQISRLEVRASEALRTLYNGEEVSNEEAESVGIGAVPSAPQHGVSSGTC